MRGAPGAGKSDLALRFISRFSEQNARLVSDDQVHLRITDNAIEARAPEAIEGRLEVRGIGIIDVAAVGSTGLVLVVDLVEPKQVPRLPPDPLPHVALLGLSLPLLALDPFAPSAAVKLKLALGGSL